MPEISLEPLKRILKESGAKRISNSAVIELSLELEKRAAKILKKANSMSKHAGRRTVMRRDIKIAKKSSK